MSKSMFICSLTGDGGNSGGTDINVIDNLTNQSSTDALSAKQGYILNENAKAHANKIASTTELGHVMVDGTSIVINSDGKISAVGGGVSPTGRFYEQAVLETTIIDQETWKLPFVDFNYPQDLLIVSQNSTFLNTDMFTVTKTGNDWFVNIPNDSIYPLPIANNTVFAIAIKGYGGGTTSIVQKSYEEKLQTTSIGQNKWEITTSGFDPVNDTVFPVYNSTLLTKDEYTITVENNKHFITINDIPNDQPIKYNNLTMKVLFNTVSTGMNDISGQLLINGSVSEDKLMQNIVDKINSRTIQFEEQGAITAGLKNAHRAIPFSCLVNSVDATVLSKSTSPIKFNIKTTTDFQTWNDLFSSDLEIQANGNIAHMTLPSKANIAKDTVVRLVVTSATGDAQSLAINLNVTTI